MLTTNEDLPPPPHQKKMQMEENHSVIKGRDRIKK